MSSGYCPYVADTIDKDDLKKVGQCGVLLNDLESILEVNDYNLDAFAREIRNEMNDIKDDVFKQAEVIYQKIQKEFQNESDGELELELNYHDSDNNGDCYDEVNGAFWEVFGAMIRSPKAVELEKKYEVTICAKAFVNYG